MSGWWPSAFGEVSRLLHECERLSEVLELEPPLDPASVVANLPLRSLTLVGAGLLRTQRGHATTARSAGFLGQGCWADASGVRPPTRRDASCFLVPTVAVPPNIRLLPTANLEPHRKRVAMRLEL